MSFWKKEEKPAPEPPKYLLNDVWEQVFNEKGPFSQNMTWAQFAGSLDKLFATIAIKKIKEEK